MGSFERVGEAEEGNKKMVGDDGGSSVGGTELARADLDRVGDRDGPDGEGTAPNES